MTDLIPDRRNPATFTFDRDELMAILQGNFRSRKCLGCDGTGWVHYNCGTGQVIGTGWRDNEPIPNSNDWIAPVGCEDCNGFGQIIKLGES